MAVHPTLVIAWLVLFAFAKPIQAHAQTAPNLDWPDYKQQVTACFLDHRADPLNCMETVLAPCEGQPWLRNGGPCHHRLTNRWRNDVKELEQTNPFLVGLLASGAPQDLPKLWYIQTIQSRFNQREGSCIERLKVFAPDPDYGRKAWIGPCALFDAADWWFLVSKDVGRLQAARTSHLEDIESLEACILESHVSGQANACIGIFRDDCELSTGEGKATCAMLEGLQWLEMLYGAVPHKKALTVHTAATDSVPEAYSNDCIERRFCFVDHLGRLTIQAMLAFQP